LGPRSGGHKMSLMAKQKKPDGGKKPPQRTKDVGIQFYTDSEVAGAFARYLEELPQENRPVRRALLESLLIKFLTEKGYWPPPDDE
jgi:hypothetical protein